MNNKSLFLGLLVFGAGVGSGYVLGITTSKKQHQEDLAEVKDFYMQKLEEMGVQPEGFDLNSLDPIDGNEEEVVDEELSEEYFNKLTKYSSAATTTEGQRRPITNYSKPPLSVVAHGFLTGEDQPEPDEPEPDDEDIDEDYEESDDELDARAEELAQRRYENMNQGKPYTINHDEYEDGPDNYGRQTLYYYANDRVLCEEDDSLVEDEEGIVGFDYEDVLDTQTTAWVRNDEIMTLYEIHRIDQSYASSVANVAETPREREFRLLSRKKEVMDR